MSKLPLPGFVSLAPFLPDPNAQTYTQIFNDTMGSAAAPGDDLDLALANAANIAQLLAADGATDPLGTILGSVGAGTISFDPSSLDQHVADFINSHDASTATLSAVPGSNPPDLLQLPMNIGGSGSPNLPPIVLDVDLGKAKVGDSMIAAKIGEWQELPKVANGSGIIGVSLAFTDSSQWGFEDIVGSRRIISGGQVNEYETDAYYITFTPTAAGTWQAQVNYSEARDNQQYIVTYKIIVS